MAILGPGTPVAYTGVSPECCEPKAHGDTPIGALAIVSSIIPESEAVCGHIVVVRTQEGHTATARPDEVKPLDDWGVQARDETRVPEPAST